MGELQGLLDREAERFEPSDGALDRTLRLARRRTRGRRLLAGITALTVALAGIAGAWVAFRGGSRNVTPASVLVPTGRIDRITLPQAPQNIAAGEGAAWVHVGAADGQETLSRIDASTARAEMIPSIHGVQWLTIGYGAVWVGVCPNASANGCPGGAILKLDPRTGRVLATIQVGEPFDIQAGLGAIWVADAGNRSTAILKIDPATGRILARFACCPGQLRVGEGAVWVVGSDGVTKLDPLTGRRLATTHVPMPLTAAVGEGAVWVVGSQLTHGGSLYEVNRLYRIDPATARVTGVTPLSDAPELATGYGWVWATVTRRDGSIVLSRIDPVTRTFTGHPVVMPPCGSCKHYAIPGPVMLRGGGGGPAAFVAVGAGAAWVSDLGDGQVLRVDLGPAPVSAPSTIVLNPGRIWFDPPGNAQPQLTSSEAMANYRAVNPDFQPPTDPIAQLGLYTAAVGDGTYRYKDQLAWGFTWHQCAPFYGRSPPPDAAVWCTPWLFLNANTGESRPSKVSSVAHKKGPSHPGRRSR